MKEGAAARCNRPLFMFVTRAQLPTPKEKGPLPLRLPTPVRRALFPQYSPPLLPGGGEVMMVGAIIGLFYEVIKKSAEYLLIYEIICIFATEKNKRE